jgi:hypothetical protein
MVAMRHLPHPLFGYYTTHTYYDFQDILFLKEPFLPKVELIYDETHFYEIHDGILSSGKSDIYDPLGKYLSFIPVYFL